MRFSTLGYKICRLRGSPPPSSQKKQEKRLRWDRAPLDKYWSYSLTVIAPLCAKISECLKTLLNSNSYLPNYLIRDDFEMYKLAACNVIDEVYSGIVAALTKAAAVCIPAVAPQYMKHWWNEDLNIFKKEAHLAFARWRGSNKPASGALFENYMGTKKLFRKAVKKRKNDVKNSVNTSLLEALNSSKNFWALWKAKLGKKRPLPPCVSGATEEKAIAATFAAYFSETCSINSKERSDQLRTERLKAMAEYPRNDNLLDHLVDEADVAKAIDNLKGGKAPGPDDISGEHIKNAHPVIHNILTKLFNCIILTEHVPAPFGKSTLVPIPKAGKSHLLVNGYRGISLTPVVSKIFERCLLAKFLPFLKTSERQFGFKAGTGCPSAVYSVRKTIEYFTKNKSTVTVCSLDMEAAFDKMNRDALFIKMMKRGVPLTLIKIFEDWFSKSFSSVRWGAASSDPFALLSGTRQGGVFSPLLFALFIDDILCNLENLNCGCNIKNICVNSFMYADDLILLSISIRDMTRMLDVCKSELDWLDMKINHSKSSAIRIGERWDAPLAPLAVGDKSVQWVEKMKYLGVVVVAGKSFSICLHAAKIHFFQALNAILGKIGDVSAISLILSILAANCVPVLFYSLEASCLTKAQVKSLDHAYNAVFFKLFKSFDKTVINHCQFYTGFMPAKYAWDAAKMCFLNKLTTSAESLAGFLCHAVGQEEWVQLTNSYGINAPASSVSIKRKVWEKFQAEVQL